MSRRPNARVLLTMAALALSATTAAMAVPSTSLAADRTRVEFQVAPGLKLLKVRPNRGTGTAALKLMTLGPGKLTLSGRGVERQAKQVKRAGVYSLIVRPTGRALRSLVRNAQARVRVTAALRPPGGQVSMLSKTIVLERVG
jgi:hypothetical protein